VPHGVELRLPAEVPLADQRRRVARGAQLGPDRRNPERQTDRRRYEKLAGSDDSFAALKDDARFKALLKEFDEPAKAKP